MSVVLRAARDTDAGKLGAMITDAVTARPWKPRLHSAAQDIDHCGRMIDRGWVTVAERDGRVLGFVARQDDDVQALFVAQDAQGAGIGSALLTQAKQARDRLVLWTFLANAGARRFYDRHGFAELERGDGSGNEEGLPDVRLEWRRPAPQEKTDG